MTSRANVDRPGVGGAVPGFGVSRSVGIIVILGGRNKGNAPDRLKSGVDGCEVWDDSGSCGPATSPTESPPAPLAAPRGWRRPARTRPPPASSAAAAGPGTPAPPSSD